MFDKAEYQRKYMAKKRGSLTEESNNSEIMLDKKSNMLDKPVTPTVRHVSGRHDHTCPSCQKVWSCSFEQDGICWRDPHCLKHTATPPYEVPSTTNCRHGKRYCRQCGTTIQPITATPEQWTNAYNTIQAARDRASTADKQAARQAAAQQG